MTTCKPGLRYLMGELLDVQPIKCILCGWAGNLGAAYESPTEQAEAEARWSHSYADYYLIQGSVRGGAICGPCARRLKVALDRALPEVTEANSPQGNMFNVVKLSKTLLCRPRRG